MTTGALAHSHLVKSKRHKFYWDFGIIDVLMNLWIVWLDIPCQDLFNGISHSEKLISREKLWPFENKY